MMKGTAAAVLTILTGALGAGAAAADEVGTPPNAATPGSTPSTEPTTTPAATATDLATAPSTPNITGTPDLDTPPTRWGNRMLAGHTFLFPVAHAGAFITTNFGVSLGVYDETIPSAPIPGGQATDLNLIGLTTEANLGIKLTDWLGIQGQARALGLIGLDGQSIIYAGGQLNGGGFFAPIVRLARIETTGTQISARAQMGWLRGSSLEVPRFLTLAKSAIDSAANSPDAGTAAINIGRSLLQGGLTRVIIAGADTFELNASLEAAQALGPMFGLQAAVTAQRRVLGVTFNDPQSGDFRDSVTRYDMAFDISAEWDGMSMHVPVAAIVEYDANVRLGGTGDEDLELESSNTHTLGVGIYYSGRPDLQVGIFGAAIRNLRPIDGIAGAPGMSGTPHAQYGEMVMRYVW